MADNDKVRIDDILNEIKEDIDKKDIDDIESMLKAGIGEYIQGFIPQNNFDLLEMATQDMWLAVDEPPYECINAVGMIFANAEDYLYGEAIKYMENIIQEANDEAEEVLREQNRIYSADIARSIRRFS